MSTEDSVEIDDEIFGPLFVEATLEKRALKVLKRWLPTYVEVARQRVGFGQISPIKSWLILSDVQDRFTEEMLPALTVESPGTRDDPVADGDGTISATWDLGVIVEFPAPNANAARTAAQIYSAAIRGALMQRRSLEGLASSMQWLDVALDGVEGSQRRTRFVTANAFAVEIPEVVNWRDGPATPIPPAELPVEWPGITDIDLEVEPRDD